MYYSMTLCKYLWRDKKNPTAIFQCESSFFCFFPESHKTNPCASTHKVTSASTSQMLDFSCGQLCFPPRFCLQQLIRVFQPSTCNWWLRDALLNNALDRQASTPGSLLSLSLSLSPSLLLHVQYSQIQWWCCLCSLTQRWVRPIDLWTENTTSHLLCAQLQNGLGRTVEVVNVIHTHTHRKNVCAEKEEGWGRVRGARWRQKGRNKLEK